MLPRSRLLAPLLAVAGAALIAGCGGDSQAEDEAAGTYEVDITRAEFREQHLGAPEDFVITVRNAGDKAVPNVSVSVDGFSSPTEQAGVSDRARPVWIVDEGPRGGDSAYVGGLDARPPAPGASRTPLAGDADGGRRPHRALPRERRHHGEAKATLAGDAAPEGTVEVSVAEAPAVTRVDPETGDVLREGGGGPTPRGRRRWADWS